MSDLVDFLRARLDEDAELATDAKDELNGVWTHVKTKGGRDKVVDSLGYSLTEFGDVDSQPWWTNPHIARHDPARTLREVERDRRIIDEHEVTDQGCETCGNYDPTGLHAYETDGPCTTLRLLALPYADHPDYREEWRP